MIDCLLEVLVQVWFESLEIWKFLLTLWVCVFKHLADHFPEWERILDDALLPSWVEISPEFISILVVAESLIDVEYLDRHVFLIIDLRSNSRSRISLILSRWSFKLLIIKRTVKCFFVEENCFLAFFNDFSHCLEFVKLKHYFISLALELFKKCKFSSCRHVIIVIYSYCTLIFYI